MILDFNKQENCKKFVDDGWDYFAAVAYKEYLSVGRGIIYIDLGVAEEIGCDKASCLFHYFTPESKPEFFIEGIAEAVEEYDPEREVVFVCYQPNEDTLIYVVSRATLTPPQAFLLHITKEVVLTTPN
jgi:hypothetical protein